MHYEWSAIIHIIMFKQPSISEVQRSGLGFWTALQMSNNAEATMRQRAAKRLADNNAIPIRRFRSKSLKALLRDIMSTPRDEGDSRQY